MLRVVPYLLRNSSVLDMIQDYPLLVRGSARGCTDSYIDLYG